MRIGMVTACYKPVVNGVTRMVSLYKQYLEAAGHEVTVFTLGEPDPAGEEPGVIRTSAIPLGDTGYYFNFRYNKEAREKMKEMDIIHCHHLLMSMEMAHRYGRCPIVYTNHTRYDLYTGNYIPLPQAAADAIMRQIWPELTDNCDVVITPSASVRDVMINFGVRRPIEVIENGVEVRKFWNPPNPHHRSEYGVPESGRLLVYIGRLAQEKNLDILFEQFKLAADIVPDLHLLVIGKGPLAEDLPWLAEDLGIADRLHMPGAVPFDEVPNVLAAADAFVTASVTEVHPLTIIEAMAAGLPIAAVRSPGIEDTVTPGHTGFLAGEPAGLAAAIVALLSNHERLQEMSQAAREESKRYDIMRTVEKTLALYERLRITRPDLERNKDRGWRGWSDREPLIEQLGRLLRPPTP